MTDRRIPPFSPRPLAGESPGSLLLRAVEPNGWRTARAWLSALAVDTLPSTLGQFLRGDRLLAEFEAALNYAPGELAPWFYRRRPAPTDAGPVAWLGLDVPQSWLRLRDAAVCPECAASGFLPALHDLAWLDVCPAHGRILVAVCPACQEPIAWDRRGLTICVCGADFREAAPLAADPKAARQVMGLVSEKDLGSLERVRGLLDFTQGPDAPAGPERYRALAQALQLLDGDQDSAQTVLAKWASRRPGLPPRALLLPLLAHALPAVADLGARLLAQTHASMPPTACGHCDCADRWLSPRHAQILLGIQQPKKLARAHLVLRRPRTARVPEGYRLDTICALFRSLRPTAPGPGQRCQVLQSRTAKKGLDDILKAVIEGQLRVTDFDSNQGLAALWVVEHVPTAPRRPAVPEGWLTVAAAAKYLDIYPDAVRRVIKSVKLSGERLPGFGTQVFVRIADLEHFEQQYVFAGTLARKMGANPTDFVDKLRVAGVLAVGGPGIDGGLVYLFRRAQTDALNLERVASIEGYARPAGRRKGDPEKYDHSEYVTSREAAHTLKLSLQGLRELFVLGWLVAVVPPGRTRDNRRYVRRTDLQSCSQRLEQYLPLDEARARLQIGRTELARRFVQSGYIAPIRIAGNRLITKVELERMRQHLEEYVTAAEAGRMLGSHRSLLPNWERVGRISPIKIGLKNSLAVRCYRRDEIERLRGQFAVDGSR